MQQAPISQYFRSTTTTATSSTSADASDEGGALSSSTDGEQDSDGIDLGPPPAKREVRRTRDHHRRSGFNSSWLKEFKWLERVDEDGRTGLKCLRPRTNFLRHL